MRSVIQSANPSGIAANVAQQFDIGRQIIGHGLIFGMMFGPRIAVFMGMTNPAVGATQFTAFMGMSALAISYGNYWQGQVAEAHGYVPMLYLDALFMLASLAVIPFLRDREPAALPATA